MVDGKSTARVNRTRSTRSTDRSSVPIMLPQIKLADPIQPDKRQHQELVLPIRFPPL